MNLLSFDIGIKNLALCYCHYENKILTLLDWKIINISNNCCNLCFRPSGILCKFCCKDNSGLCLCKKQSRYKHNDLFYCASCIPSNLTEINKNKLDIFNVKQKLLTKLEDVINQYTNKNIDVIIIENQPSLKNPVMKSIMDFIHDYFIILSYKKIINNKVIKLMSPSNKLKLKNYDKKLKDIDIKQKYKERKKLSVELTNIYLKEFNIQTNILNTSNKKDDLCDAFLMIVYYVLNVS